MLSGRLSVTTEEESVALIEDAVQFFNRVEISASLLKSNKSYIKNDSTLAVPVTVEMGAGAEMFSLLYTSTVYP